MAMKVIDLTPEEKEKLTMKTRKKSTRNYILLLIVVAIISALVGVGLAMLT